MTGRLSSRYKFVRIFSKCIIRQSFWRAYPLSQPGVDVFHSGPCSVPQKLHPDSGSTSTSDSGSGSGTFSLSLSEISRSGSIRYTRHFTGFHLDLLISPWWVRICFNFRQRKTCPAPKGCLLMIFFLSSRDDRIIFRRRNPQPIKS